MKARGFKAKMRGFKIFSGSAHPAFGKEVSKHLGFPLSKLGVLQLILIHFKECQR